MYVFLGVVLTCFKQTGYPCDLTFILAPTIWVSYLVGTYVSYWGPIICEKTGHLCSWGLVVRDSISSCLKLPEPYMSTLTLGPWQQKSQRNLSMKMTENQGSRNKVFLLMVRSKSVQKSPVEVASFSLFLPSKVD